MRILYHIHYPDGYGEDRFTYDGYRYAFEKKGHEVFPVHQRIKAIEGLAVYPSIQDVKEPVNTISMYVAADISNGLAKDILAKKPRRIIFNPGAENPELAQKAKAEGILPVNACTLVMLNANQF